MVMAAEMETVVEQRERPTLCLLVRVIFAYKRFDLRRDETTDRRVTPCSQDLCFSNRLAIQTDGNILFHVCYVLHVRHVFPYASR